jgi:hypothetical protein
MFPFLPSIHFLPIPLVWLIWDNFSDDTHHCSIRSGTNTVILNKLWLHQHSIFLTFLVKLKYKLHNFTQQLFFHRMLDNIW